MSRLTARAEAGRSRFVLLLYVVLLLGGGTASITRLLGEATLDQPAPEWFGSRPATLAQLSEETGEAYSFVVLGDIQQGLRAFRHSLEYAAGVPNVRFAVVCGDLVNNRSAPHYRLLFSAASKADPGVPVLTVPGNHDNEQFYRTHLGASPWSVRIGPDLLVGVDNGDHVPDMAELATIEGLLRVEDVRHRFVFLHRPYMKGDRPRTGLGPLFETLALCGVDAVFAGHIHRYERDIRDGVLHLSNGLGGDRSHDTDGTVVVTVVSVTRGGFTDRAVSLGRHAEFLSHIVDSLVAHLYGPVRGQWAWIVGVVVLLTLTLLAGIAILGANTLLPTVALFAPAFAPPPEGLLLTGGYVALGVSALISLTPKVPRCAGLWPALACVLVMARSPWLAGTALVMTGGLLFRPRCGREGRMRPLTSLLAILGTVLVVGAWTGQWDPWTP